MVKTVQSFCLQLCSGVTTIQRKMVIEADWCPVSGICTQTTMGLAKKLLFCNFMPRSFKDILSFSNFEVLRAVWIKMRILGKDSNQRGNSQVVRVKGWSTTVGFCQVCHLLFSLSLIWFLETSVVRQENRTHESWPPFSGVDRELTASVTVS